LNGIKLRCATRVWSGGFCDRYQVQVCHTRLVGSLSSVDRCGTPLGSGVRKLVKKLYICAAKQKERGDPTVPLFDYMDIASDIKTYLAELLDTDEYAENFLIEVRSSGSKHEVFIDGDDGVTFAKCRKISRYLEAKLEESGAVGDKYVLEVSSPGAERPLKQWRQYGKHAGRKLRVMMTDGTVRQGTLTETGEDIIFLTEKGKAGSTNHEIPFSDIKESVVQISFNK
jgi:ribosome maturation factor RimP